MLQDQQVQVGRQDQQVLRGLQDPQVARALLRALLLGEMQRRGYSALSEGQFSCAETSSAAGAGNPESVTCGCRFNPTEGTEPESVPCGWHGCSGTGARPSSSSPASGEEESPTAGSGEEWLAASLPVFQLEPSDVLVLLACAPSGEQEQRQPPQPPRRKKHIRRTAQR